MHASTHLPRSLMGSAVTLGHRNGPQALMSLSDVNGGWRKRRMIKTCNARWKTKRMPTDFLNMSHCDASFPQPSMDNRPMHGGVEVVEASGVSEGRREHDAGKEMGSRPCSTANGLIQPVNPLPETGNANRGKNSTKTRRIHINNVL